MKLVMGWRRPAGLLGVVLLLVGCGLAPVDRERPVNEVIKAADRTPPAPQWVQFGSVEWVSPATVESRDGGAEAAMKLSIRMDTGETITVTQAVSQAGQFNVGDRVRLLQIGDFIRVTYWPYGSGPSRGEPASRLPESGDSE